MRIDKLLWFLRLAPSRSVAHDWVLEGHIRINGRRVEKPGAAISCGDILTLPLRSGVKVIEIAALPQRRGPAPEAQSCYRVLDERSTKPIAAGQTKQDTEGDTKP
jgi:ribosome-associated heat shock protein Hsp15